MCWQSLIRQMLAGAHGEVLRPRRFCERAPGALSPASGYAAYAPMRSGSAGGGEGEGVGSGRGGGAPALGAKAPPGCALR
ncbi:unnamed protein product [Rangifer tarandus platyrhynchus]|uniref:Uncharacterized protein n=1 Tax=Rangifer tarandus platyrhynchus TaxID=3082113 RepID=A0ABN8Z1T5_RANTA|nr:unnamed protein product [Rangifer tarandus platyrhynchus]